MIRAALIAIGWLLVVGCRPGAGTVDDGMSACRLTGIDREIRCGTVRVAENPDQPQGRTIEVHFAVVPAIARNKESDPIFVLAGGPGQSAMRVAGQVLPLFARLNARRDIVFVDQRGTGRSNALDCSDDDESVAASVEPARQVERIRQCVASFRSDAAQYATWIAVRDYDAVRERLGAARINLWGASYGTRVALEYLRQFPDRVRTAVLDGVAPADMALPTAAAIDADAALERLVAACNADSTCRQRYPDFAARIARLFDLTGRGLEVVVPHPLTGRVERLRVDRALLAALIRTPLYLPQLSSMLPFALAEAGGSNMAPLVALSMSLSGKVRENFALGMHLAVICAEDQPLIDAERRAAAAASRFGAMVDLYAEACRVIPVRPVPDGFRSVAASSVPILILSGGLDPATPPRHAETVASRLGNTRHVVAPHLSHGISGQACAPDLITRFIRDASFARIDGACLARVPPSTFFQPLGERGTPATPR